jgi:hypothetical protein
MKRILLLAGIGLGMYAISMGSNSVRYAGSTDCNYSTGYNIQDTIPKDTTKKKKKDTSSAIMAPMPLK